MNFIIFDLEATCWDQAAFKNRTQEIIEIGAVKLNHFGEIQDSYSSLIKPTLFPDLSVFCRELTNISTQDTNKAPYFPVILERFLDWIDLDEDYLLCSWGNFDKKMFLQECQLHQISSDWMNQHINLKRQYIDFKKLRKPVSLKHALEIEGYEFEGIQHRALPDAENLAVLFTHYIDKWQY
jgi:inhibitor of KinA sporulation pathway (predicted exonuclease)